jgi:hypothetical protein
MAADCTAGKLASFGCSKGVEECLGCGDGEGDGDSSTVTETSVGFDARVIFSSSGRCPCLADDIGDLSLGIGRQREFDRTRHCRERS